MSHLSQRASCERQSAATAMSDMTQKAMQWRKSMQP